MKPNFQDMAQWVFLCLQQPRPSDLEIKIMSTELERIYELGKKAQGGE